jgi:hypothetical protein
MCADVDGVAARKSASSVFPCELGYWDNNCLHPLVKKSNMTNKGESGAYLTEIFAYELNRMHN